MEIINQINEIKDLKNNIILGSVKLNNSKIIFKGKGNILWCEDNEITLSNSNIVFNGDNGLIILSKNKHNYVLNISINNDCSIFLGKDTYINGKLNIVVSEQKNVIIGNECLISFECWLRTADPHIVYDTNTKQRLNKSQSIFIGDHVWIGQHSYILKGTQIGSGSIIGALSVVAGKKIESNASYAGNPVKKIRQNVFFTGDCVHAYRKEETQIHQTYTSDKYIYSYNETEILPFSTLESHLNKLTLAQEKLDYLLSILHANKSKNRFFIQPINKQNKIESTTTRFKNHIMNLFNK